MEFYEQDVTHKKCSTYLEDGVDVNCEQAKQRQALALLNQNINIRENLTEFDTGIMAEDIYTQSKVINLVTNYAMKFFNPDNLASKDSHKNKIILNYSNVPEKNEVLSVEDRIVDLEGAFYNHMTCLSNHKKYADYRECMGFSK